MTELEQLWRRKTDYELHAAARRLHEYSEASQQVIKVEVERRKSPEYLRSVEPVPQARPVEEPQLRSEAPPTYTNSPAWLAQRALLAVGLMIGFYLFAFAIAVALLSIPFAEWNYLNRLDVRIAAVCVGSGLTILWSLLPRRDRFTPPGPRLEESSCLRLFSIVRRIADATSQEPPSDVYLVNDVNAFVAHRGGVMGFGSRRIMGIGLPLLQAVTVPELEAIIAHEFGHYSAGDVALGPWVYKTRAAIARTIASVRGKYIQAPFLWYARHFLKLTHAVSRRQEFIADRVSVSVAGVPAAASALRRVSVVTPLYMAYLRQEVMPVLNAGFVPPISAGFNEFLASDHIDAASRWILAASESPQQTNPFDTHPSLSDRLAALGVTASPGEPLDPGESAAVLIGNHDRHARALLEAAAGAEQVRKLKPIEWSAVGEAVYPAQWRALVQHYAPYLSRYTADALPAGRDAFIRAGSDLVREGELSVTIDQRIARAAQLFGMAVGVTLLENGWEVHAWPGRPITLKRGSEACDPFAAIQALADGRITVDAWRADCHALGIAGRPLAGAAVAVAAQAATIAAPVRRAPTISKPSTIDEVHCWRCKHTLILTAETRGKTIKCPGCATKQQLPL